MAVSLEIATLTIPVEVDQASLEAFRATIAHEAFEATRDGIARGRAEAAKPNDSEAAADRRGEFAHQAYCRMMHSPCTPWERLGELQKLAWIAAGNAAAASG